MELDSKRQIYSKITLLILFSHPSSLAYRFLQLKQGLKILHSEPEVDALISK